MNKKIIASFIVLLIFTSGSFAQSSKTSVIDLILTSFSAKIFTTKQVTDSEINQIIKCGIKAPSAKNGQPWKFTVVKDTNLSKKAIPDIVAGNVLIIISGQETKQQGANIDFDCALATENMYVAAMGLGLGAHIYTGPVNNVNENLKKSFDIPGGYRVIALLKVGNIDKTVDGTASATPRKDAKDIVNYK